MSVTVRVLYFAVVRERLKLDGESLELADGATVDDLLDVLAARRAPLAALRAAVKVAVDREFVSGDHRLADGAEVALIPPVSGGAGLFRVTDEPLELAEVVRAVSADEHGGIATFTGVVRSRSRGKTIVRLEYEAYRPMAERKLAEIAQRIAEELPGVRLAIVHRVGALAVGEAAVVIAASAPHRAAAFDACRAAIERLKTDVPIWKKEIAADGEEWIGLGP
ncbi:MAG TPA: molybdopterin converting factor subunit 1 [Polyangia bacterium]|nr:molybdopterin converting factor subunit 1 [Polyangia bacterium]